MDPQRRLMLEISLGGLGRGRATRRPLWRQPNRGFRRGRRQQYAHLMSGDSVNSLGTGCFITGNAQRHRRTGGVHPRPRGPAVAMDTACSSSLVAVHQASQAAAFRRYDMAWRQASHPAQPGFHGRRVPCPDVGPPTAGARPSTPPADGYVLAKAAAVLVLKRLSDAQRDGDRICAVIRSSAVNPGRRIQRTDGAQWRRAATTHHRSIGPRRCAGADVDYLEAHGTRHPARRPDRSAGRRRRSMRRRPEPSTADGDRRDQHRTWNPAAGVAGLIKVVLSLQHELLPNQTATSTPPPAHSLGLAAGSGGGNRRRGGWRTAGRAEAGVGSFGFTGYQRPCADRRGAPAAALGRRPVGLAGTAPPAEPCASWNVLPLSARSAPGLVALAQRQRLAGNAPQADIADVCFRRRGTLHGSSTGRHWCRTRFTRPACCWRIWWPTGSGRACSAGCTDPPTTAWFFPGQGSQYPGMARDCSTANRCSPTPFGAAQTVDPILPRPLLDVLLSGDREAAETLQHTSFAQPRSSPWRWDWPGCGSRGESNPMWCWATASASTPHRLRGRGVQPRGRGAADRQRPVVRQPAGRQADGGGVRRSRVRVLAAEFPRVSVSAWQQPQHGALGPGEDLEQIVAACSQDAGTRCTWLGRRTPSIPELLDPVLDKVRILRRAVHLRGAGTAAGLQPDRHRAHRRRPAERELLAQAFPPAGAVHRSVATVAALGCSVLMEIGPQPILTAARCRSGLGGGRADTIVSLRKGPTPSVRSPKRWPRRTSTDTSRTSPPGSTPGPRLELPTYPVPAPPLRPKTSGIRADGTAGVRSSAVPRTSPPGTVYSTVLSVKTQPWLAHRHLRHGRRSGCDLRRHGTGRQGSAW